MLESPFRSHYIQKVKSGDLHSRSIKTMLATNCLPVTGTKSVTNCTTEGKTKNLGVPESATNLVALLIEVLVSGSNIQAKNSHGSYTLASLEMNL